MMTTMRWIGPAAAVAGMLLSGAGCSQKQAKLFDETEWKKWNPLAEKNITERSPETRPEHPVELDAEGAAAMGKDDGDGRHVYVPRRTISVDRPVHERFEGMPQVSVWITRDNGVHWSRAGYFDYDQTRFEFEVPEDGDYGVRVAAPGDRSVLQTLPKPEKIYHVDTQPPQVTVAVKPEFDWCKTGEALKVAWFATDENILRDCTQAAVIRRAGGEAVDRKALGEGLGIRDGIEYRVPEDAVNLGLQFEVRVTDRAGNVGAGLSPMMQVIGEQYAGAGAESGSKSEPGPQAVAAVTEAEQGDAGLTTADDGDAAMTKSETGTAAGELNGDTGRVISTEYAVAPVGKVESSGATGAAAMSDTDVTETPERIEAAAVTPPAGDEMELAAARRPEAGGAGGEWNGPQSTIFPTLLDGSSIRARDEALRAQAVSTDLSPEAADGGFGGTADAARSYPTLVESLAAEEPAGAAPPKRAAGPEWTAAADEPDGAASRPSEAGGLAWADEVLTQAEEPTGGTMLTVPMPATVERRPKGQAVQTLHPWRTISETEDARSESVWELPRPRAGRGTTPAQWAAPLAEPGTMTIIKTNVDSTPAIAPRSDAPEAAQGDAIQPGIGEYHSE